MKCKLNALNAFLILCATVGAQIVVEPDADLWGGGAINPSGEAAVPILQYDPSNGEMWIHTVGLNQISETTIIHNVEGDDVGMVSLSLESPPAVSTSPEFVGFFDACVWNGQYFNGKQQVFCIEAGGNFLRPTHGKRVWTFDAGLTPSDFGTVEMGVNFTRETGSTTIFGQVQFVPEPSGFLVAISLSMGLFSKRRTRQ
ncbi:MAG: hypothetical protein AAF497_21530 [Planctomycetota bacterium]